MTELNFKNVLAEQKINLIKSNLTNLASAHLMLSEDIARKKKEILVMENLQLEIQEMGDKDPNTLHVDSVRNLYSRCYNYKGIINKLDR